MDDRASELARHIATTKLIDTHEHLRSERDHVEQGPTLEDLYRAGARAGLPYLVAEALVALSESFWQLTAAHVHAAARTIGQRPGTGGTSGVAYLEQALRVKAFPELWEVRTRL